MIFSLSFGMPIPVSVTENATTRPARLRTGWSIDQPPVANPTRSDTPPASVNLHAFEIRLRRTCWSRLESVAMAGGRSSASSTSQASPFVCATGRKARST